MVGMGNECEYESASVPRLLGESFVGYAAAACIVFAQHLCPSPAHACAAPAPRCLRTAGRSSCSGFIPTI
jgi:hypothetical protein